MPNKPGPKTNPYRDGESWKTGSSARAERLEAYLEWMLTPEPLRSPSTKKAFAEALGVSDSTLWRYEQDRYFQREYMRRYRGTLKVADVGDIVKAQVEIAKDTSHRSSTQAARLVLDWVEKHEDKQGPTVDLTELDESELLELVNEFFSDTE